MDVFEKERDKLFSSLDGPYLESVVRKVGVIFGQ